MAACRLILILFCFAFSIAKAEQIPELFKTVGKFCDVPASLLYSVAKVESNRSVTREVEKPWPWTLNIDGNGYYFDNREEMFDALMDAISNKQVVDIGFMQLNWHWKYELLVSPWMATEPLFNVTIACRIIRDHFDGRANKDWLLAAGLYHREADSEHARDGRKRYINRVRKYWN